MADFRVLHIPCGVIGTNTYVVYHEDGGEAVVIDPAESTAVLASLEHHQLKCVCVLLTHGHFDHVMGVEALRARYECPVVIGAGDEPLITDPEQGMARQLMGFELPPILADRTVNDGDTVEAAGVTFRVFACPGHTKGGVSYLAQDLLFCGDTLFQGSIGRTDFPGGSFEEIAQSIRRLYELPDDTKVLPGHGDMTTIGYEAQNNPYVRREEA